MYITNAKNEIQLIHGGHQVINSEKGIFKKKKTKKDLNNLKHFQYKIRLRIN
jgi:hypothetical protein